MDNRDNIINDNNAKSIKNNLKPRGDNISQKIDFSVVKGMKLFPLFDRREDNYIYEKKFYNELPKDLVHPKAFNLNSNVNNFAKFDMMTMLFGLKKSQDLLTNPRLNTNIHLDFISNSLYLIFPENKLEFRNKTINAKDFIKPEENKQMASFKQDILDIIDSKDESEMKEKEVNPRYDDVFYLRNTMLLSGYLNINKKASNNNKNSLNNNNENLEKNKHNTKSQHEEYIKSLEKTFEESEKFYEGMAHPSKKGVKAKNVYRVFPFFEFDENKFSQIIFPEDPAGTSIDKLNESNAKQNENPTEEYTNAKNDEKFILKSKDAINNSNSNKVFTLYKNELEDTQEAEKIQEEIGFSDFIKSKVSFFNFDREYTGNLQNKEEELFNRYLIFINKTNKTAKILPVHTKLFLKKHKTSDWQNQDMDNEEDYNNRLLNKKRERDIAIVPKNIDLQEIKNRNNSFHNSGFIKQFSLKVDKIQNIELERIAKARKRTESQPKDQAANDEDDVEDELFGNEFNSDDANENSEKDYEEENDLKQEDSHKDYEEENNYSSS